MANRPAPREDTAIDAEDYLKATWAAKQFGVQGPMTPKTRARPQYIGLKSIGVSLIGIGELYGRLRVSEELSSREIREKVRRLDSSVESIRQELISCKEAIDKLREGLNERPIVKETRLFDIDEKLDVIQPIPIVVEEFSNEVIASFLEIEMYAVADSEPEAISNLKTEIRDLYYELIKTPKDELGKLPLSWLRILERLIRKRGDA